MLLSAKFEKKLKNARNEKRKKPTWVFLYIKFLNANLLFPKSVARNKIFHQLT